MKPLKGVVVKENTRFMRILLESGNTITIKPIEGFEVGDKVDVAFDFTKSRVADVRLRGEREQTPLGEPTELDNNPVDIYKLSPTMKKEFSHPAQGWEELRVNEPPNINELFEQFTDEEVFVETQTSNGKGVVSWQE